MSLRRAGVSALILVLCLTACGGSKHSATTPPTTTAANLPTPQPTTTGYTLAATQECLETHGLKAYRNDHNAIVGGSGGELRVVFGYGQQWIYIAFGKSHAEALAMQNRAVRFAVAHNDKLTRQFVLDGVRLRKNVFYYADGGAVTQFEGAKIERCLT